MVWSSCEIVNNRLSSDWVREVSVERMGASWVELNWRLPCYRVAVAANYDHTSSGMVQDRGRGL